jgi:hypothetical protein
LLPYTNSYDQAASSALTANNPTTGQWSDVAIAPDGSTGWWQKTGAEPLGQIFIWGISDTPDLAAYGLIDAQLCNNTGAGCVAPSTASVTAALNSATKDSAGLLIVDPAKAGKGGYPLVQVTYAAVPTNQRAAALNDYAALIAYATGAGQTPGVAPGDLPPGYLPLPASLRAQAQAAVARLRAIANPSPSPSHSHSATPSPTPSGSTSPTSASSQPGGSATQPAPTPGIVSSLGYVTSPPTAQLAATNTPGKSVGTIRWVLLAVLLAGAACAAIGGALRYARAPRWLHRMRP